MRTGASLALLLLLGCGDASGREPRPPEPPPLRLQPTLPSLQEIAAEAPPPPAERLAQLLDLGRTAFEEHGDARLAARCRASLLAEPDAGWALEQLLLHDVPAVRSQAAFALAESNARTAVIALALRPKYERDPLVLVWIADALATLGSGAGLELLAAAMDQEATAQQAGAQAIAILRRAGHEVAETPTWQDLQAGLRRLDDHWRQHGELPGVPPPDAATAAVLQARVAQRLLVLPEFQLRPVDDTRFSLARCGTLAVPLLRRCLSAEEPYLRSHALEVVGELGPAAGTAAPELLPLLRDPLSRVDAARALARIGAAAAAPLLRPWLASPEIELRAAAAGALGLLGDRAAEPRLLAMMRDPAEAMDVRVMAAFSLAVFERAPPGIGFLRERLAAEDYHAPTVRELLDRAAAGR